MARTPAGNSLLFSGVFPYRHNFLNIYFGSEITTKPDLIEGDSVMKSFIAGYYQAKGQELGSVDINTKSVYVRPKTPFGISSKTWSETSFNFVTYCLLSSNPVDGFISCL